MTEDKTTKLSIPCEFKDKGCDKTFTNYPNRRRHSRDVCPYRLNQEEDIKEENENWKTMSNSKKPDPTTDIGVISTKLIEIREGNINLLKGENDRCTPSQEKQIKKSLKDHKLVKTGDNFRNLYIHFSKQELLDDDAIKTKKEELDSRIDVNDLNPIKHKLINYARALTQDELEKEIEFGLLYVDLVTFLKDYQKNTNLYAKELIHSMLTDEEREGKKRHRSLSTNSKLMNSQTLDDDMMDQINKQQEEEEDEEDDEKNSNSSKKTKPN